MLEYSDIIEKELFEFLIDDKGFSDTHVKTVKDRVKKVYLRANQAHISNWLSKS